MSTLCEFYVTHTAHILAFTTSTNECTQIQYDTHHKIQFMTSIKFLHVLAPEYHPWGVLLEKENTSTTRQPTC